MKDIKIIAIGFMMLFIWVLFATTVSGAGAVNNLDILSGIQHLDKLTSNERETLAQETDVQLRQTQEALLTQLDSNDQEIKFYAAYFLGEYRISNAANDLAQNIALEDKANSTTLRSREWLWDRYPAMEALIKIGNPAIPSVIQNLANSDDIEVRQLSLHVLKRIDGNKDISQLRLQIALKAEADPKKQMRLQSTLKSLSDMK